MSILDQLKADVKKAGSNKSKFIYFREGEKRRIRFLNDMEDAVVITMHNNFEEGINAPCRKHFGKDCPLCDREDMRTRDNYVWSVWDYDANEVKLFMFAVNRCSPIPALMAMYENFGTLCDRDYIINVQGRQLDKTYSVINMDKQKFRNTKAKPYTEKQILKMLDQAFPFNDKQEVTSSDDDDSWDDDDKPAGKYDDMKPKALYDLCIERKIEAEKKKPAQYYINLLEEADKADDDWGDDDDDYDDDEWEDEE